MTVVCQGHRGHQVPQALQGAKVFQDVMENMAKKDQWGFQGLQGHLVFWGHLERRVYLDLQVEKGPQVLQVPEVNQGHLQMWMPVPGSQGFLECQAQEDQKELWGSQDREAPQD